MKRAIVCVAALLVAAPAAAHPGHGVAPDSWLHAFVDPPHVFVTMGALACGVALGLRLRRGRGARTRR